MPDKGPLQFHVPEPEVRPGDTPDFSKVVVPPAGEQPRPPVDAKPEDIRDLAYTIIRVLNDEGQAVGPWAGSLTDDELAEGYGRLYEHAADHAEAAAIFQAID